MGRFKSQRKNEKSFKVKMAKKKVLRKFKSKSDTMDIDNVALLSNLEEGNLSINSMGSQKSSVFKKKKISKKKLKKAQKDEEELLVSQLNKSSVAPHQSKSEIRRNENRIRKVDLPDIASLLQKNSLAESVRKSHKKEGTEVDEKS